MAQIVQLFKEVHYHKVVPEVFSVFGVFCCFFVDCHIPMLTNQRERKNKAFRWFSLHNWHTPLRKVDMAPLPLSLMKCFQQTDVGKEVVRQLMGGDGAGWARNCALFLFFFVNLIFICKICEILCNSMKMESIGPCYWRMRMTDWSWIITAMPIILVKLHFFKSDIILAVDSVTSKRFIWIHFVMAIHSQ